MYALDINTRVMYVSESFVEAFPNVLRNEETFFSQYTFIRLDLYFSSFSIVFKLPEDRDDNCLTPQNRKLLF